MNIKKGDTVIVLKGKDAGKKAKVVSMLKTGRVLLEGLNTKKKNKRAPRGGKGQTVEISHSIARANIALLDPKKGTPTRLGSKIVNGKKVRIAKKSGQEV